MTDNIEEIKYNQRRYMGLVGSKVINEVGRYDGSDDTVVSLASRILNTGLIGLNTYLYDTIATDKKSFDEEELDTLSTALTLQHVEQIVSNKTGEEGGVKEYYENDWFELKNNLEHNVDEVQRLVESPNSELGRYCQLATSTADVMTNNSSVQDGYEVLQEFHDDAQMIQLTRSERPLTHYMVIEAVEQELHDMGFVVLGSTPTGILYLGSEVETDNLIEDVSERVAELIASRFNFGCKAKFRSVSYNALPVVELPLDEKRRIISDEYIENVITDDASGTEPIETIPDEFVEVLPEALHKLYVEKDLSFEDERLVEEMDDIKEEYHGMKYKMWIIQRVLEDYDRLGESFIEECRKWTDDYEDAITPEGSPLKSIVEVVFGESYEDVELPSASNSCFLCGQHAENSYQGGRVYGTNSTYSRRTSFDQDKKSICTKCNMEDSMISSLIDDSGVYGDDIAMVYLFFDNFSGSIAVEELADERVSDVLEAELAFTESDSDGLGAVSLYNPLVHMQPVALDSGKNESDSNKKLRMVRNILKRVQDTGMKARVTTPFRPFDPSNEVFKDSNPVQAQLSIGAEYVERYEDVDELVELLDIGNQFHGATTESYPYQYIVPPKAESLIHNAERKFDVPPSNKTLLQSYIVDNCSMNDMKKVASLGFDLVGYQYESKHAKTKMFREALDALLDARQKNFDRDGEVEIVAGAVMRAAEDQSDYVDSETVEEFSEALVEYCEQYDTLHELSNKKNSIADTYKFAFERVMDEHNEE
jgi:hypothetical protein